MNSTPSVSRPATSLQKAIYFFQGSAIITLVVLAALGAAGRMSPLSLGGCYAGLGLGLALSCLACHKFSKSAEKGQPSRSKVTVIALLCILPLIVLGNLCAFGIIPPHTLGWIVVGSVGSFGAFGFGLMCFGKFVKNPVKT